MFLSILYKFCFFKYYQYLRNVILSLKVSSLKNLKYLNNILIRYMHLFILIYPLQYAKRLVTELEGKRQFRYIIWMINWALQIQCNPRYPVGGNKLILEDWTKRNHIGLQRIYLTWYSFLCWVKVLLDLLNFSNFLSLDSIPPKIKIISFWFETVKNDRVWRNGFQRFITILNVSVNIKGGFFQLVSVFSNLDSKFNSVFTEELKISWENLNTVYTPI